VTQLTFFFQVSYHLRPVPDHNLITGPHGCSWPPHKRKLPHPYMLLIQLKDMHRRPRHPRHRLHRRTQGPRAPREANSCASSVLPQIGSIYTLQLSCSVALPRANSRKITINYIGVALLQRSPTLTTKSNKIRTLIFDLASFNLAIHIGCLQFNLALILLVCHMCEIDHTRTSNRNKQH
jgi:hypothetical protein